MYTVILISLSISFHALPLSPILDKWELLEINPNFNLIWTKPGNTE
jgi:hypothetical protein